MVTHDPAAAAYADSVVFVGDLARATAEAVAERMTNLADAAARRALVGA
jgi:putative ABC transport system ATP-binding protein